jgi:hypothetical protein
VWRGLLSSASSLGAPPSCHRRSPGLPLQLQPVTCPFALGALGADLRGQLHGTWGAQGPQGGRARPSTSTCRRAAGARPHARRPVGAGPAGAGARAAVHPGARAHACPGGGNGLWRLPRCACCGLYPGPASCHLSCTNVTAPIPGRGWPRAPALLRLLWSTSRASLLQPKLRRQCDGQGRGLLPHSSSSGSPGRRQRWCGGAASSWVAQRRDSMFAPGTACQRLRNLLERFLHTLMVSRRFTLIWGGCVQGALGANS